MLVNLNSIAHSAFLHLLCKVTLYHAGPPPTPSYWLGSTSYDASQGDLFDVVNSAALLKRIVQVWIMPIQEILLVIAAPKR
ncbi:hypothetical protein PCASD_12249 [Puccinia coronata f. sp. avenae]|uniref:Uncharacterized protein n=1 Tax=Puccinia coronata f. sp. avenae TaxID=200324 RepID=A0A2N5T9I0_9BASI|nr:hypothetical protein PCASD_12249 [Puccinia coronata f. sp. avenae]